MCGSCGRGSGTGGVIFLDVAPCIADGTASISMVQLVIEGSEWAQAKIGLCEN